MCSFKSTGLVLASIALAPLFAQSTFTITDLGTLPGSTSSTAVGINDTGQVVGKSGNHAFLWQDGVMTDLGTLPGDVSSTAGGINASGQVFGTSSTADGRQHAFLWDTGVMTPLGTLPGGNVSVATGINDSGQVVGWSTTANGTQHAFLWDTGVMTDLGTLNPYQCNFSAAYAVNNNSQVVGTSSIMPGPICIPFTVDAFFWDTGVMSDMHIQDDHIIPVAINDAGRVIGYAYSDLPGPRRAWVWENSVTTYVDYAAGESRAINDSGQVVGYHTIMPGGGPTTAFLWDGVTTDLGTLTGFPYSVANGINNQGQVVGTSSVSPFGLSHAFLWDTGVMTDLGTLPGDTFSTALRINNIGQAIGQSGTDGNEHAVLWCTQTTDSAPPVSSGQRKHQCAAPPRSAATKTFGTCC